MSASDLWFRVGDFRNFWQLWNLTNDQKEPSTNWWCNICKASFTNGCLERALTNVVLYRLNVGLITLNEDLRNEVSIFLWLIRRCIIKHWCTDDSTRSAPINGTKITPPKSQLYWQEWPMMYPRTALWDSFGDSEQTRGRSAVFLNLHLTCSQLNAAQKSTVKISNLNPGMLLLN